MSVLDNRQNLSKLKMNLGINVSGKLSAPNSYIRQRRLARKLKEYATSLGYNSIEIKLEISEKQFDYLKNHKLLKLKPLIINELHDVYEEKGITECLIELKKYLPQKRKKK